MGTELYQHETLTSYDKKMLKSMFKEAKREANVAINELYSPENIDEGRARNEISFEEFMKGKEYLNNFSKDIAKQIRLCKLPDDFDFNSFKKEYNKIGAVMSWARDRFDYNNPIVDYYKEIV